MEWFKQKLLTHRTFRNALYKAVELGRLGRLGPAPPLSWLELRNRFIYILRNQSFLRIPEREGCVCSWLFPSINRKVCTDLGSWKKRTHGNNIIVRVTALNKTLAHEPFGGLHELTQGLTLYKVPVLLWTLSSCFWYLLTAPEATSLTTMPPDILRSTLRSAWERPAARLLGIQNPMVLFDVSDEALEGVRAFGRPQADSRISKSYPGYIQCL